MKSIFVRILAMLMLAVQWWWRHFLVARGWGKLGWSLVPLVLIFACIGLADPDAGADTGRVQVTSAPQTGDARGIVAAPTEAPRATNTPRPTTAPEPTAPPASPTPASEAAALLPEPTAVPVEPTTTPPPPPPPPAEPTTVPPTPTPLPMVATVKSNGNVRDVASAEGSTVIGQGAEGQTFTVIGRNADSTWYAVDNGQGVKGWMSASLLTLDPAVVGQVAEASNEQLGIEIRPTAVPAPAQVAPAAPPSAPGGSAPCAAGQIKANRNSDIYHAPGQRDYAKTTANVQCFDTEAQASAAGYRRAKR